MTKSGKGNDKGIPRIIVWLIVSVGAIWAGSLVLDMVNPAYDPPQTIGLAFMAILSTLLGIVAAAQRDGGKKNDEDGE
ncbi:membrane protein [Gordonia phage Thimann]|uniref:Membrane protein n=1 Tax=Gordonia phage Suerte TaxID=2652883 RepID=A0A5P8DDB4_9CAUD|nr:membrane protein [Gordonia phage Suerte]QFP96994.1 membrane protein [Gordonia phage Suerte]WNM74286.1 membrane protein [Gordonia phage Thimann]